MIAAFGIKIDTYSVSEFYNRIVNDIENGKRKIQITGINIEQIALLKKNPDFITYCNASDYVNIDGTSVSLFLKCTGHRDAKRALCADIFLKLLEYADAKRKSIYFLGARPETISILIRNIRESYPNVNIVGYHDGFYKDEQTIVQEIKGLHPTFLFLGMPSPMKEHFITLNKNEMNVALSYGVGGMFDIIAGIANRAPSFWQKYGLEWLYRISQNPIGHTKRVCRALLPCVSVFIKNVIGDYSKQNQEIYQKYNL